MVKSLEAKKVIDYTKLDFTKNSETYDVIFDTTGKLSLSSGIMTLNKKGILDLGDAGLSQMFQNL